MLSGGWKYKICGAYKFAPHLHDSHDNHDNHDAWFVFKLHRMN